MCSDCVTLILFKEEEESSTIRLILIKCQKDYERNILYTYPTLKSSLKVWQIYILFPKRLPQPSQPDLFEARVIFSLINFHCVFLLQVLS